MLLAIGFVNPLLLAGLALIAAPLIIHWLSRRQFKRIPWAATRFLLEAEKENRRRRRMEQWLLLGLRCLAMALLALLVARPFVRPGLVATLLGAGGQRHRVIVIDDSASLSHRSLADTDLSRLIATGERLLRWLSDAGAGDQVSIYRASTPAAPVVDRVRLSNSTLADLQAKLRATQPTALPAPPRRVLEQIRRAIDADSAAAGVDLYLLSDFQRGAWAGVSEASGSAFEPLLDVDPARLRVVLIGADDVPRENLAVVDVKPQRPQIVAGVPALFSATLANHTTRLLENVAVQVEVGGAAQPAVTIERVEAGAEANATFEVTCPDDGLTPVVVSVSGADGLPQDDAFRYTARVLPALRVLAVNGQPAAEAGRDEVYYLRNALAPPGSFASGLRVEVIDPADLEQTDLSQFDCVFLCNVAAVSEPGAALLMRYVRAGGGLIVTAGSEFGDGTELTRLLGGTDGLLPTRIEGYQRVAAGEAPVRLLPTEDADAEALLPPGLTMSEGTRFEAYLRLAEPTPATASAPPPERAGDEPANAVATSGPASGAAATVLARLTDASRTPLLVERGFGRGQVALLGTTVDLDWNDWARAVDGSYVVAMLELTQRIARRPADRGAYTAGEPLVVELPAEQYEAGGSFRSPRFPDQAATPAQIQVAASVEGPLELRGPEATELGMYAVEVKRRDGSSELRPLAVNLPPAEGDLASAAPHELKTLLGRLPHEFVLARDSFAEDESAGQRELWSTILMLLVACLFGEQALATALGRPARSAARRARGDWRAWLGAWRRKAA